jgi:hypothetical protein
MKGKGTMQTNELYQPQNLWSGALSYPSIYIADVSPDDIEEILEFASNTRRIQEKPDYVSNLSQGTQHLTCHPLRFEFYSLKRYNYTEEHIAGVRIIVRHLHHLREEINALPEGNAARELGILLDKFPSYIVTIETDIHQAFDGREFSEWEKAIQEYNNEAWDR